MALLRVVLRFTAFATALACYSVIAFCIFILAGFSFNRARPFLNQLISLTSKVGLVIFNVKVKKNFAPVDPHQNFLIVSNHLSYLDIMVISSFFPTCFVTSKEMKETPFLGQICLLAGCLFVERRSKAGITKEVQELTDALDDGLNIVIFPEATSTNGEAVIRFRRPLFQAAIKSHSKVLPVCINYRTLDGEKVTIKNRDKVFWYGDMEFLNHVLKLFSHKSVVAELTVLPSIDSTQYEDKTALSEKCFELVSGEFEAINPIL